MTENEFNRSGIFRVPYYDDFRIDNMRNIYVINEDNEISRKIPCNELKFMYKLKQYYPMDLYSLAFYGVRNPLYYDKIDLVDDKSFIINGMVFKRIDGYGEYLHLHYGISSAGSIYSYRRKELRKREIDEDGYTRISWPSINLTHVPIHRIVYKTWVGDIPEGKVIDHIDNNKWNNYFGNLRCVTNLENSRMAANDGLYQGYLHLTEDDVKEICELLSKGYNRWAIAHKIGIDREKDPKAFRLLTSKIKSFQRYKANPSSVDIGWKDIIDMYDFKGRMD